MKMTTKIENGLPCVHGWGLVKRSNMPTTLPSAAWYTGRAWYRQQKLRDYTISCLLPATKAVEHVMLSR